MLSLASTSYIFNVFSGNMSQLCQERWQPQSFIQRGFEPAKKEKARYFSVKRHTLQHTPISSVLCAPFVLPHSWALCSSTVQDDCIADHSSHTFSSRHKRAGTVICLAKGHTLQADPQYDTLDWITDTSTYRLSHVGKVSHVTREENARRINPQGHGKYDCDGLH